MSNLYGNMLAQKGTLYSLATNTSNGLMSSDDKKLLYQLNSNLNGIKFEQDSDGNWGYIKPGETTITGFGSGGSSTGIIVKEYTGLILALNPNNSLVETVNHISEFYTRTWKATEQFMDSMVQGNKYKFQFAFSVDAASMFSYSMKNTHSYISSWLYSISEDGSKTSIERSGTTASTDSTYSFDLKIPAGKYALEIQVGRDYPKDETLKDCRISLNNPYSIT